jgi:hypothetical protein
MRMAGSIGRNFRMHSLIFNGRKLCDNFQISPGNSTARPAIPKRGEKDFEPVDGGGSGLQRHNLERARSAMFDALRSTRAISRCDYALACLHTPLLISRAQQIRKLCSLVPTPCACACHDCPGRSFYFHGPLSQALSPDLGQSSEKTGAPTRGSTLSCGEGCPLLLESVSRCPQ